MRRPSQMSAVRTDAGAPSPVSSAVKSTPRPEPRRPKGIDTVRPRGMRPAEGKVIDSRPEAPGPTPGSSVAPPRSGAGPLAVPVMSRRRALRTAVPGGASQEIEYRPAT